MQPIIEEDLRAIAGLPLPWGTLKNKTILVTGATGMIPAYFVYLFMHLNAHHHLNIRVLALARSAEKAAERFAEYAGDPLFQPIIQDVCAPLAISEDIHIIIHGASQASPKYYGTDPVGTLNANVLGTHNLLALGREKGIELFLFLSTGEVYGIPGKPTGVTESDYGYLDILNVRACYAEGKRLAETMCVCWQHQYGVPVKIARVHHTYGPGLLLDDGRVYADFVSNIVHGQNITLNSDGTAKRPFCYISDCVSGMLTILFKGSTGTAYNVANTGEYLSIRQLAELLMDLYPEKGLRVVLQSPRPAGSAYLKSPVAEACPSVDKLAALGWRPVVSAREGFARTIQTFL